MVWWHPNLNIWKVEVRWALKVLPGHTRVWVLQGLHEILEKKVYFEGSLFGTPALSLSQLVFVLTLNERRRVRSMYVWISGFWLQASHKTWYLYLSTTVIPRKLPQIQWISGYPLKRAFRKKKKKERKRQYMVVLAFNPSTWEPKAGEARSASL